MRDGKTIRRGCFDLVPAGDGVLIRLNHYTKSDDDEIFLTPVCVVYPELEYQINKMVDALTGILEELRKQGCTRVLSSLD